MCQPACFRIGTVQSDDPAVYQTVRRYVGVMDAIAAVSATIQQKIEGIRDSRCPRQVTPLRYSHAGRRNAAMLGRARREPAKQVVDLHRKLSCETFAADFIGQLKAIRLTE